MDGAAGGHRRRRVVGSAGRQGQADDRAASCSGPGRAPSGCGRGSGCRSPPVTGAPGSTSSLYLALLISVAVAAAVARRAQRLAVGGVAGQHIRAGQPGAADRADRAAGADRPARQDHLPGRARRAVPAGAVLLHRAAVRRHDHRAEAADRRGVGRRRRVEVRQALLQRRSRRWSATARRCRSSGSSGRTTATSRTTCGRRGSPTSWRTCRGTTVEIVAPLVLLFSTEPVADGDRRWSLMVAFHLFIISTFPLAVPLEWNVLFAYATIFLFLGFPTWHGYAVADMSSPWLTAAIVAGAGVLPDPGQLAARTRCRSCRRCASTPATGRRRCGRSRRAPRRS